jgi:1-deoxy-D-xylulose-5-phosphate reductoisomerase
MKQTISILGSTGSVGLSTLKIIDKKKNLFKIEILSANQNFKLATKQIKKYKPRFFIIANINIYKKLKNNFKNKKVKIINNFNHINLKKKIDITVSAIPGIAGLKPTIIMTKLSKKILIANKESVICGWNLIQNNAKRYKTKLIPVDSEHYSILKLLENHKINEIKKIYITASGGPFLNYKVHQLKNIKLEDALKHPKWKMGKKITVDSSNLMNKILELIEAKKIFDIPEKKLDVIIHPECLIHAIIQLKNGLNKIIYHETSMIIPLANAIFDNNLNIEEFLKTKKNIKGNNIKNLTFKKVNSKIFPAIKLKKRLFELPSTPIVINAVNEVLVGQFLKKKIPFISFFKSIMSILNDRNYKKYAIKQPNNIKEILLIDAWARKTILNKL